MYPCKFVNLYVKLSQVSHFLINLATDRLPAQQPKTWSAYASRGRYAVLGSIYYGLSQDYVQ